MQQSDFEQCQDFINKNLNFINSKEDCCKIGCAFQKLNPSCLILLSNLLAIDIAKCLPLNQQNVVGNFLLGVGQSILIFGAQQTYMESGPGNCYNLKNFNSNNPDCTTEANNNSSSNQTPATRSSSKSDVTTCSYSYQDQIDDLKDDIRYLKRWIDED
ncbi:MAG TPA: hypothetical protein DCE48_10560 [Lachnospiraceae bacterium]|uniref:hypothetical protein n=1 Tax=Anaerosporobacter sp. TaxID=1872529 RepID=UPI000EE1C4BC|nr:hypothetical protein [Anaerosporobacter sp.]HAB61126.1 hypothetical protein [Lachnospiraceae bacterium]